ncbi:hypothetical protein [Roseivirga seohaensis]|uniref:hypothetical protein n=1 Tax=Roseivirga seohaensis TaxID=1914963 RepID=UPI003BAB8200
MQNRKYIEQIVLGMSLEKNYPKARKFVSSRNFSAIGTYSHRLIWSSMDQLYPLAPIDIVSVSRHILKNSGQSYHYYLSRLSNLVVGDNIEYHALELLEIDIRSKLLEALKLEEAKALKNDNLDIASVYQSIYTVASDDAQDLFELFDSVKAYISAYLNNEIPRSISLLIDSLPTKVKELKSATHLKQLIKNILVFEDSFKCQETRVLIRQLVNHLETEL